MTARQLTAKYVGWCRGCGAEVREGATIWYDGKDNDGARIWHQDCLPDGDVPVDE